MTIDDALKANKFMKDMNQYMDDVQNELDEVIDTLQDIRKELVVFNKSMTEMVKGERDEINTTPTSR